MYFESELIALEILPIFSYWRARSKPEY